MTQLPPPTSILDLVSRWDRQKDWGHLGVFTFDTKSGVVGAVFESRDLLFFCELHTRHQPGGPNLRPRLQPFLQQLQRIYPTIMTWKVNDAHALEMLLSLGFRVASVRAEDGSWAHGVIWRRGDPGSIKHVPEMAKNIRRARK